MHSFTIKTTVRNQIIDITDKVRDIVNVFSDDATACLIDVPHTTCAIMIQENYDPNVHHDILDYFERHISQEGWRHALP